MKKLSENNTMSKLSQQGWVVQTFVSHVENTLDQENTSQSVDKDLENDKDLQVGDIIEVKNKKSSETIKGRIIRINQHKVSIQNQETQKIQVVDWDSIEEI